MENECTRVYIYICVCARSFYCDKSIKKSLFSNKIIRSDWHSGESRQKDTILTRREISRRFKGRMKTKIELPKVRVKEVHYFTVNV